jgi:acetyltransferase-like isoleucine patch superfamily enzyme
MAVWCSSEDGNVNGKVLTTAVFLARSHGDSVAQVSVRLKFRRFLGSRVRSLRRYLNEVAIVGPDDDYAKEFFYFGSHAALMAPLGVIYNERYLSIGDETLIGPNVCLTAGINGEQAMLATPTVSIGRKCVIGRGSHVIGHWSIELGDEIQTGPYVYITDQNHSYEAIDEPVGWQRPSESAVKIGSGSWLGANVVILPGTTLGQNTTVAAGAVVRGVFPDHVVLGGVPAKVLRHYSPIEGWVAGPQ